MRMKMRMIISSVDIEVIGTFSFFFFFFMKVILSI